ncbi:alpha/beta hydrolase [Mycobacterium sp. CVI_P3]|uniref:Alpha/beta hydrolase n=1 Tax=Mycobacterium pinniadriaticum TaxID=2994102 RepID=A0ABT3SC49_9MYCO|nr:alpha/beta hydrolase [Mycobacterium pinniadriaticum]MCX2930640.1 alpha/beta hydrolase [Mycobacterium pinniadriaticum]MCX2937064.1 alpha/beta hydrolase [Mycobacterium pinniadriaticum]
MSSERSVRLAVQLAVLSALAAAVANSTLADRCLRRVLPGLSSAVSVVPLAVLGLFTSEFPRQVFAVEAAAGLALAPSALRRGRGRWALLALATSWLGLLLASRRGHVAGVILDGALKSALGVDYRSALPVAVHQDMSTRRQDKWIPKFSQRPRYLRHADLSYGTAHVRNDLDIWYRNDLSCDGRAPVLLQIHGSAWVAGSKRGQGYPLMAHMTERGWVCVAINYSLAPVARWPAHIIDVKRALAWVKREIAEYGGDPNFIALTGGSAGGHLTALAALTPNEPVFQPGFEDVDTAVAAAVPFYGVYDLLDRSVKAPREQRAFLTRIVIGASPEVAPKIWTEGSPMHWIRPDAPPFFVLHGSIDTLTPPSTARRFAEQLSKVSREPVVFAELPGAQHMWEAVPSVRTAATVAAVDRFLTTIHRRHGGLSGPG